MKNALALEAARGSVLGLCTALCRHSPGGARPMCAVDSVNIASCKEGWQNVGPTEMNMEPDSKNGRSVIFQRNPLAVSYTHLTLPTNREV